MTDPDEYQRVEPDDPRRCQGQTPAGQCRLISIPGTDRCICHGGYHQAKSNEVSAMRRMMAVRWRGEVGDLADSSDLKSLHTELGILRMMLLKQLNACHTDQDLLLRSGSISEIVIKIQKLVDAAHRLDVNLGVMLDKTQLLVFGQKVIELVSKYIANSDTLQLFTKDLMEAMAASGKPESKP